MEVRVGHTSYVIDFLDVGFYSNLVSDELLVWVQPLMEKLSVPNGLSSYTLEFRIVYNGVTKIGVARKSKTVESLKLSNSKQAILHALKTGITISGNRTKL